MWFFNDAILNECVTTTINNSTMNKDKIANKCEDIMKDLLDVIIMREDK